MKWIEIIRRKAFFFSFLKNNYMGTMNKQLKSIEKSGALNNETIYHKGECQIETMD